MCCLDVERAIRQQTERDDSESVHKDCESASRSALTSVATILIKDVRTPVPDAQSLLLARVEHASHDHECRHNGALADREENAANDKRAKVLGRRMAE